jgi:hypothetical protein
LSFVEWNIRIGIATVALDRCLVRLTPRGWARTHTRSHAPWQAGAGEARWAPALASLASLLGPKGAARARVVLSSGLVHYAVLPWNPALAGAEQDRIFLGHRFRQLYGDAAAQWQLRCEYASAGRARLASAVDVRLIDALKGLLGGHGIKLQSIVPALADSVNRYRTRLDRPSAWLACQEEGCLCVARWHDWEWVAARSLRTDNDWRSALPSILAREECLHDAPSEVDTVFLDAADGVPASMPGWTVLPLRTLESRP